MKELLDFGLLVAAWCLTILCVASFWIPKALGWQEKLAGLTPLMRELFWTYSLYIWSSHVFFAVLAFFFRDWLLGGTPAAAAVAGFICFWWLVRLGIQFFGFDLGEVEDTMANRLAKHLLTLLFLALVIIFALTVWWNLGGAR